MTKESIRDRISRVESGLFTTQVAQIPTGAITLPTGHQGPGTHKAATSLFSCKQAVSPGMDRAR
jgi:hypothetical protein